MFCFKFLVCQKMSAFEAMATITTVILSKFQFLGFYLLFSTMVTDCEVQMTLRDMRFMVT